MCLPLSTSMWLNVVCGVLLQSLQMLPIFLASCQQMLIVAGPTYVHRLWCMSSSLLHGMTRAITPSSLSGIWEIHVQNLCWPSSGDRKSSRNLNSASSANILRPSVRPTSSSPHLQIVGIGSQGSDNGKAALYNKLKSFQLDQAHCYDPNEASFVRTAA